MLKIHDINESLSCLKISILKILDSTQIRIKIKKRCLTLTIRQVHFNWSKLYLPSNKENDWTFSQNICLGFRRVKCD